MIGNFFDIDKELLAIDKEVMELCKPYFERVEEVQQYNQLKVLKAFKENRISAQHLGGTTGYGYDDAGREALGQTFADVFHTDAALVRTTFVNPWGTRV